MSKNLSSKLNAQEIEELYQIFADSNGNIAKTSELSKRSKTTIVKYSKDFNWKEKLEQEQKQAMAVFKANKFLDKSSEEAIDKGAYDVARRCLYLSLTKLEKVLSSDEEDSPLGNELQKIVSSLEKFTSGKVKESSKGVSRTEAINIDMAKIAEIRLEHYRKTGETLTEQQIIELGQKDYKKV